MKNTRKKPQEDLQTKPNSELEDRKYSGKSRDMKEDAEEGYEPVDEHIKKGYTPNAMHEGFASASGVRGQTAESNGRIRHPETRDAPSRKGQVRNHFENENSGLADN